jgi:branched-chain amino acid transport system ATP-binding protein
MAVDDSTGTDDRSRADDSAGTVSDPVLETRDLTRQFGQLTAVDDVSLSIDRGEFRSVIGPNGAGKTTLFNLISGALAPTSGAVLFDGEDVSDLPPHERVRRGIGRSFQITNVFPGLSVRENVRLAAQGVAREGLSPTDRLFRNADTFPDLNERTDEVLDRIDLADRADTQAAALAYGDRRQLEIGLVLATDPAVVLLDEPTAGMGAEGTSETMALIEEVLADRTLVLIEHDVDLVLDISDRITVLDRGAELVTGDPETVASDTDVQEAYLGGEVL